MKKTLIIFVLFFSSSLVADDISDFQIEGMSIGDSLLNYFSKTEIENFDNLDYLPSNMKFRISYFFSNQSNLELYDGVQVYYKLEDKNFIIHGLSGFIDCYSKNECEKIFNDVLNDLSIFFKNSKKLGGQTLSCQDDKTKKSKCTSYYFKLRNGWIVVQYQDWTDESGFQTNIRVEIATNEVDDWINNNYGLN